MKKRSKLRTIDKPIVPISKLLFQTLAYYMISEWRSKPFLNKLNIFFDMVNTKEYAEDGDIEREYRLIASILKICIEDNITNTELILEKLGQHKDIDDFAEVIDEILDTTDFEAEFDSTTATYLENEFISRLNFFNITGYVEELKASISKYEKHDFESFEQCVHEIQSKCNTLNKKVLARSSSALAIPDLNSSDDSFLMQTNRVKNYMNDTRRVIKTGIKRLNRMLNGGFHGGRVYVICATSGGLISRSR